MRLLKRALATALRVELQLSVFAKARGIVVHQGQSVAEALEQWVHLQDALFQVLSVAATLAEVDKLLDHVFGGLRLACTAFATNDAALAAAGHVHCMIGGRGHCKDVRRPLLSRPQILIQLLLLHSVQWKRPVRVHHQDHIANVSVCVNLYIKKRGKESAG